MNKRKDNEFNAWQKKLLRLLDSGSSIDAAAATLAKQYTIGEHELASTVNVVRRAREAYAAAHR